MMALHQHDHVVAWDAEDWDLPGTVSFVQQGGYKRVALQLPDDMLWVAPKLAASLQAQLPQDVMVAVLADSAFNPEAVDEVAAQHIAADCVVHYGRASLAATASLPVYHVFPRVPVDVAATAAGIAQHLQGHIACNPNQLAACVLLLDQGLLHAAAAMQHALQTQSASKGWQIVLAQPSCSTRLKSTACAREQGCSQPAPAQGPQACSTHAECSPAYPAVSTCAASISSRLELCRDASASQETQQMDVAGYTWELQTAGAEAATHAHLVYCWVGPSEAVALQALQIGLGTAHCTWLCVEPSSRVPGGQQQCCASGVRLQEGVSTATAALLKRRYFLVEKARAACILGVLVGTLAAAGLTDAMAYLRKLISAAGKRSYTVLVGKPTSAKLANFPEVEVWVQLSDPLGAMLDSRPFLAPLITPHEAVLALTGKLLAPGSPIPLGVTPLLVGEEVQQQQLAAARAAFADGGDGDSGDNNLQLSVGQPGGLALQVQQPGSQHAMVQATHGAQYLAMRSWQGVEAPVAGAAVKAPAAAVDGLAGRAAVYTQEPSQQ